MTVRSPNDVRGDLRELARPVAAELRRGHVLRQTARLAGLAAPLLVFPCVYLVVVGIAAIAGVDLRLAWFVLLPLTLLLPALRVSLRWQQARRHRVGDATALVAIDRELQLADRLSTAHEFLAEDQPDGFRLAAIRDAERRIAAARAARPSADAAAAESPGRLVLAGLAALLVLWGSSWIVVAPAGGGGDPTGGQQVAVIPQQPTDEPRPDLPTPPPEASKADPRTVRRSQQGDASTAAGEEETPTDASRRGRNPLGSGRSAEARTAAGGGSERGQPSNQAQSTKGEQPNKQKKPNKPKPRRDDEPPRDEPNKPPQESGSTQGRGSGKGSSKSPTASPWSAKDQVVSDEEQDPEEDEEVDDENDESKARGGVQPNLRARKPPVNRDLQISMGNGKPQDDANGRGGPGGPKKQRGVAQLVLGVTFPDHVSAKPNPGMSKITQERIEPQAQEGDRITGEGRGRRAAPMGHLSRRVLSPWMQDLVRSFYLSLRKEGGPQ